MNNAYNMLKLLRDQVGEGTASHWSDENLVRRLNLAQKNAAMIIEKSPGAWLLKSETLTPVDSVITLPSDCAKPLYLEEVTSGKPLAWLSNVRTRRVSRTVGVSLDWSPAPEVYPLRKTIEVNQDSYTTQVRLWYDQRVPDLVAGTAAAGGATSLTLPDDGNTKHVDDYYNDVEFQAEAGTGAGTVGDSITDYVGATGVCVVTGTYGNDTEFGTITKLPEEAIPFMLMDATVLAMAKPSSNIDEKIFQYYTAERKRARKELEEWVETRIKGHSRVEITEEMF